MNKKLLIMGITLFLTAILTMGILSGLAAQGTIGLTPTPNPYPTPAVPRQGVAPYTGHRPYLPQLGSWAYVWWAFNGQYPTDY